MKKIQYIVALFCCIMYFSGSSQTIDPDSLMRVFKERRENLNQKREELRLLLYQQSLANDFKKAKESVRAKKDTMKKENRPVFAKAEKPLKEKKVKMKKITVKDDVAQKTPKIKKEKKEKKKDSNPILEDSPIVSDSTKGGESVMQIMIPDSIRIIEEETRLVVRIVDDVMNKNDHDITIVIDSILSLNTFSPAIVEIAGLIVDYANSYQNEDYEDLSDDQIYIRHFVTFLNDPGPHPSQQYYENVWDTVRVFCYAGRKFETTVRDTLILIDPDHPYHKPCDIYTDQLYIGNALSRDAYDKHKYDYTCKCFKLDKEYIHGGCDIRFNDFDKNPKIYSVFDGEVRIASLNGGKRYGYGNVIVIRHYNGTETIYAHLDRMFVKSGDIVKAGEVIGIGGSTGGSTAKHLHFAILVKGRPLDPESVINLEYNPKYKDRYAGSKPYGLCADQIYVNERGGQMEIKLKYRLQDVAILKGTSNSAGSSGTSYTKP